MWETKREQKFLDEKSIRRETDRTKIRIENEKKFKDTKDNASSFKSEKKFDADKLKMIVVNFHQRKTEKIYVKDLKEASTIPQIIIKRDKLLTSYWYRYPDVGKVYNGDEVIAYVSANGRVWEVNELGNQTQKEIVL